MGDTSRKIEEREGILKLGVSFKWTQKRRKGHGSLRRGRQYIGIIGPKKKETLWGLKN